MTYLNGYRYAFLLLDFMKRNQMDNEIIQRLLKYAEGLSNAENG